MKNKILTSMKNKILLLIYLFIFIGCTNQEKQPDIGTALIEVTTKFPQLPKGGIEHYQLEKSIKNAKYNFEILLYSEAETVKDAQKILVFINIEKKCYAIPLFSNTYREYWEFKNELPLEKIKKVKSTFSEEYFDALMILKLNKIDVSISVTNDLLISLLNCDKITSCEFSNIKKITFANSNTSLDTEANYDHLKQKWVKNNDEMLKTQNWGIDDRDVIQAIGYLDFKNYRFHQVILNTDLLDVSKNPKKIITSKKDLQIKSYRKDQIIRAIHL
jgi:hypothetical protein